MSSAEISFDSGASGDMKTLLRNVYGHICSMYAKLNAIIQIRTVRARLRSFSRPYKLHLGCGSVSLKGWINLDSDASLRTTDVVWDLTQGIPLDDLSCELVYCEHLLEHFTVEQGLFLLSECHRVLEPDGVLRLAMPSLDILIKQSYLGNWREQEWLSWPQHQLIRTRGEMLNIAFRGWGHKWLYDWEELQRRLKEAGFKNIKKLEWGVSDIGDLKGLETRKDSLLVCEARKE